MLKEFLSKGVPSIIVLAIAVFLFWFWISMLIDCLTRDLGPKVKKVLWFLVIAFLQIPGAFSYWLAVARKKI